MANNALETSAPQAANPPFSGRAYFWLGTGLCLLGLLLAALQFNQKILIVPWYSPILATLGAVLLLVAVVRRRSFQHIVALIVVTLIAGAQWLILTTGLKLPDYTGPVEPGHSLPAFRTTLADGSPFTDQTLRDGSRRAMVFFRGRW